VPLAAARYLLLFGVGSDGVTVSSLRRQRQHAIPAARSTSTAASAAIMMTVSSSLPAPLPKAESATVLSPSPGTLVGSAVGLEVVLVTTGAIAVTSHASGNAAPCSAIAVVSTPVNAVGSLTIASTALSAEAASALLSPVTV